MADGTASAAGRLTTHVLDTMAGRPGADLTIELFRLDGDHPALLKSVQTNTDGRCDAPLLAVRIWFRGPTSWCFTSVPISVASA